ncbi:MAG: carbon-nitrogen hydrolase family protein [Candidatus Bathyarchaeia archaeon]|jgi:predicted amidohydrolase
MIRLAAVQLESSRIKGENLTKMRKWVGKISKFEPDLIVFPEEYMFYSVDESPKVIYRKAESLDGPWVRSVARIAKDHNTSIIVGTYEREEKTRRVFNTTVYVDSNGELQHVYRKTHLYDAFDYKESDEIAPGDGPLNLVTLKDIKFGLCVCYEVRFPEVARTYALAGADLLVIPTAWVRGLLKEEHLLTMAKARSIENTMYVAISALIGGIYTGISVIFDPMGVPICRATDTESFIIANINRHRINEVRNRLPLLNQRRSNLYKL